MELEDGWIEWIDGWTMTGMVWTSLCHTYVKTVVVVVNACR